MKGAIIHFFLGAVLLFLFVIFFLFYVCAHVKAYSDTDIISAVNSTRIENKQTRLIQNSLLNQAATAKLADIQKYLYWSHDNPQTGKKWLDFIRESNYRYDAGENLARGYTNVDKIIIAWLNSPNHRKNLLSPKFNSIGIAVGKVNFPDGIKDVVVLEFGVTPTIKPKIFPSDILSSIKEYLSFSSSPVVML